MESSYGSEDVVPQLSSARQRISRGIMLTNKSIQPSRQEDITLLHLPVGDGRPQPVTVYELAPCSMACPAGFYLIHLTCLATDDAETDLKSTAQQLFHENSDEDAVGEEDTKPCVLWSLYFNMIDTAPAHPHCDVADNVIVVSGPDAALDFDHSIAEARKIFEQICGTEEEFLPAAPDPEDIIYDDGEGKTPGDSGFSSDMAEDGRADGSGDGKETSEDAVNEVGGRRTEEEEDGGKEPGEMLEGSSQGDGETVKGEDM